MPFQLLWVCGCPSYFCLNSIDITIVVCCCKLNKTPDCDEHLFGQINTCTGRYQLPLFRCTILHQWRYARLHSRGAVMTSWAITSSQHKTICYQWSLFLPVITCLHLRLRPVSVALAHGPKQNWNCGNILEMCQNRGEDESLRCPGMSWDGLPHPIYQLKKITCFFVAIWKFLHLLTVTFEKFRVD